MSENSVTKIESRISKGEAEGAFPAPLDGRSLKFIGIPDGLNGVMTFLGSLDGIHYFRVMKSDGRPFSISTSAASSEKPETKSRYNVDRRMVTVENPNLFRGIHWLAPEMAANQSEDRLIEFYVLS